MHHGTDSISPEQRVLVSDPRFDMRMTGKLDDESALRTSWPWAAALLIAGMFIVSGYIDEESQRVEAKPISGSAETSTSNTTMPMPSSASTFVATSQSTDHRSAKGY
jgi:hypothetical protein